MAKEIKTDKDTKLHKVCSIEIDINTQMKIMSTKIFYYWQHSTQLKLKKIAMIL
jgi:hypothetical protein